MKDTAELIANIKGGQSSAHAYILEGSPKEAREELIRQLLSGLGVHGLDIVRMEMSGKNGYRTVDAEAFCERLEMGAYGDYLIGLIDDADSLTEIVQNKLLKTLEEPRAGVIIILGASNRDSLLSTVRSRCSALRLSDYMDVAGEEQRDTEGLGRAASLMTDGESAFCEFREAAEKSVKSRQDALALIDMLEDGLRERMMAGEEPALMAERIEAAERTRMDIERDMDKNKALRRLYLELAR
ncbi:MAG: hypothetical protein IKE74_09690 [Mogibacterium sp.]|nr:hypothetical protein [Mogibacterium sp.]